MKTVTKLFLIFFCAIGILKTYAAETQFFSLLRQNGTALEGYFSPPSELSSPIVFALQGSSCESAFKWHAELSRQVESLGLGVIVLEKQGISRDNINLLEYNQTNCLQNRFQDYIFCLEHMDVINPGWKGKIIFWGDSEGGMLAANLASQLPQTAAILLFASGGGIKPREEVKWAIRHRLKMHGSSEDETDQYMNFLNEQMDAMVLDPTSEKQFLGNTYKWWASLLTAEEGITPLNQCSIPVCLFHGVEDCQIPVHSADLVAENLERTNIFNYLRLEGYGHNLDTADIRNAACSWLASILFGQEVVDSNLIVRATFSSPVLLENAQTDMSDYVFSRGRDRDSGENDRGGKGEVYGGVSGSKDSNGNDRMSADVGVPIALTMDGA